MGYHAIYNVEWLGWDLVEPLTFTVAQGLFIYGMLAASRNKVKPKEFLDESDIWKGHIDHNDESEHS